MNEEKKIAQAILDAQKMREESHIRKENFLDSHYTRDIESCLIEACKKNGLSPNLWALLNLAMHRWNDIQLWAEDILAGRDVGKLSKKEDERCEGTVASIEGMIGGKKRKIVFDK